MCVYRHIVDNDDISSVIKEDVDVNLYANFGDPKPNVSVISVSVRSLFAVTMLS